MSIDEAISEHYTHGQLAQSILSALEKAVDDPTRVTADDLAPVDEFHVGGREATVRFLEQLDCKAGSHVLDVGSGIGGPARYAAASHGWRVTGIDLTPEYCEVASILTTKVGLDESVDFRQGSALDLPFDDAAFDGAYMIHVGMNIADKDALYREIRRVLKPDAVFGIYDILGGPQSNDLAFPVPWSAAPETSFLASADELRGHLDGAGFRVEKEMDRTPVALEFFERLKAQAGSDGPPPLGLHMVMGPDFPSKVANVARGVQEGCCAPWEFVCRA